MSPEKIPSQVSPIQVVTKKVQIAHKRIFALFTVRFPA